MCDLQQPKIRPKKTQSCMLKWTINFKKNPGSGIESTN